jgi:DNA polymerase-3 subunit delta
MAADERKKPSAPPVSWFHGEDAFMMERAVEELVQELVEEESRPFDFELLHADDADPEDVAASANRLPVMSDRRVVVLKRMEKWTAQKITAFTDDYVADPSPETCLILCYAEKPDRRKKAFQVLEKKAGQTKAFTPTGNRQLVGWVENYFRQRGMTLEPGAAETVVGYLGTDLYRLKTELQKIELFHAGRDEAITVSRLESMLEKVAVQPVWDLAPLLARGDRKAAVELMIRLLESGDEAIPMVSVVAGHFRKLILARAIVENGGGTAQLERVLPGPPWLVRKQAPQLLRDLRTFDDGLLDACLDHFAWADAQLKRAGKEMIPTVMTTLAFRLLN